MTGSLSRYGELLGELDNIADDTYEGSGSPALCGRAASAIRQLLSEVRGVVSEKQATSPVSANLPREYVSPRQAEWLKANGIDPEKRGMVITQPIPEATTSAAPASGFTPIQSMTEEDRAAPPAIQPRRDFESLLHVWFHHGGKGPHWGHTYGEWLDKLEALLREYPGSAISPAQSSSAPSSIAPSKPEAWMLVTKQGARSPWASVQFAPVDAIRLKADEIQRDAAPHQWKGLYALG